MSTPKLFSRTLVAAAFLFAPILARGQGVPWYTIPLPIPNGFVDASTGNLHLEIPLGPPAQPARDGDPVVIKVVYDSNNASFSDLINNYVGTTWTAIGGNSHAGTASYFAQSGPCPSGYPVGSITTVTGFYFQDSHFTTHSVQNENPYTKQINCNTGPPSNIPYPGNPGSPSSANAVASDGSGYTFSVTNYNQMQVFSSDGWLVYDSVTNHQVPTDMNGNYGSQ